jgi:hypothetical protein
MRRRLGKRLMPFAGRKNPVDSRYVRHLDLKNWQHDFDAGEANIRDRDVFAMAERSSFSFRLQSLFKCLQAGGEPIDPPGADSGCIKTAGFGQVFDDARMGEAG